MAISIAANTRECCCSLLLSSQPVSGSEETVAAIYVFNTNINAIEEILFLLSLAGENSAVNS